ncbi:DUF4375 domain-containing protein [Sphingobium amiense]|uniref:DUF4375 domain-containing protein n=1 Tax=Sphingobium amiense TaxID=135719 RepID=A0A494WG67_9SPHN|nr:DUF4375 domain-containing protein [Sphingobium amiense]BBD99915.1 DUF4375 domain-containing protein [Sphingobium amiense]
MIDTRPIMTDIEFNQASTETHANWWMTGETLIHVTSVMSIEGWNSYGHSGHMLLTPAQRTLMMWSDIVGQVQNGGFIQFCDNYADFLHLAVDAVRALQWPELNKRFCAAMAEQASDAAAPVRQQPVPLASDPKEWAASRTRVIRLLARRGKRWWQPTSARRMAVIEAFNNEWQLQMKYIMAVSNGELAAGGERYFEFVHPPSVEAKSFDNWFYTTETKADSARYVLSYIRQHRDELHRTN